MGTEVMCGKGWDKLIFPLKDAAEATGAKVLQVKEKFGGLRFYVADAPRWLEDMIDQMERLSYHVCERCGKEGKLRQGDWLKTLCEECNSK